MGRAQVLRVGARVAGVVVKVGSQVKKLKEGDEVYDHISEKVLEGPKQCQMAEYTVVEEKLVALKPGAWRRACPAVAAAPLLKGRSSITLVSAELRPVPWWMQASPGTRCVARRYSMGQIDDAAGSAMLFSAGNRTMTRCPRATVAVAAAAAEDDAFMRKVFRDDASVDYYASAKGLTPQAGAELALATMPRRSPRPSPTQ
ncbi:hypothetical protein ZWY2020_055733 [Hordeum vulgare]|nr:hypothetical protein ZWY2020_055733 [Hordeum vulgare]